MKFVTANVTASVPTTFSLAMNPVTAAAANCQIPKPSGMNSQAIGVAMLARMLVSGAEGPTT
ncbi:MAG: hypothetical protein BWY50_01373 [Spirochaetes bacterium ADurb.Bin315]|nr:MAG: hypothetical protein BWY50_01373 [Spirochaetes bacterium ADurb.Bin315]